MNFAGNTGEFHRDLGQKVTIKGEGKESDDNIPAKILNSSRPRW